jgi:hypothetical protein
MSIFGIAKKGLGLLGRKKNDEGAKTYVEKGSLGLSPAGLRYYETSGLKNTYAKMDKAIRKIEEKKNGGLVGGQKKLDKNKDGKITSVDFKMMKKKTTKRKKK